MRGKGELEVLGELLELVRKEKSLVQEYKVLAEKQIKLIQEEDVEGIIPVLEEKDRIIKEINALNAKAAQLELQLAGEPESEGVVPTLAPSSPAVEVGEASPASKLWAEAQSLRGQMRSLLTEARKLDEHATALLERLKAGVEGKLLRLYAEGKGARSYKNGIALPGGLAIDEKK